MVSCTIKRLRFVSDRRFLLALAIAPSLVTSFQPRALAQIIPDNTLPINSNVPAGCINCIITGGTVSGTNLFHSFSQFSIPMGGAAVFQNGAQIQNIITRVTGGSSSTINGLIQANGTANLFLINPNGILLGANASLNIGGSFIASTANSLRFADGSEFSAVTPQPNPLLTVSVPLGLQFGQNPAPITVQGPGHNLRVNLTNFDVVRTDRPVGLRVNNGQTLALIGGDVTIRGGNLTAAAGQVALGSVGSGSLVTFSTTNPGWAFNYSGVSNFQDIRLSQAASVDVSANGGGAIQVQGRRLTLTDGATLLATTLGNQPGQGITVQTTDAVELVGFSTNPANGQPQFPTTFLTDTSVAATARGGRIAIATGTLRVADGAQISASALAAGNAGSIGVNAQTIELVSGVQPFGASGLFTTVVNRTARGNGGNIALATQQLTVLNGAQIAADTRGFGNAGNLDVNAQAITLSGTFGTRPSGLFSQTITGQGGNIRISADRLQILGGAQVGVNTFGSGNAGSLFVRANQIDMVGSSGNLPSALVATAQPRTTGAGGNLTVEAGQLRLANGAQIATATAGSGNAGTLTINARTVEIDGVGPGGRSGLFASAVIGTGAGGDIRVTSDRLSIQNGGTINVSNFSSSNPTTPAGQGAVGNLFINSNWIELDRGATMTATSAGGDRGNIALQSNVILLRRGSNISTNALGGATGGNILINTDFLVAVNTEDSNITANAISNFGGRVTINALGIFGIQPRTVLTPFSDITASSNLGPQFSGVVEVNTPDIDPSKALFIQPAEVDTTPKIAVACERIRNRDFVITGRGGLPQDASQPLRGETVWQDLRLASSPPMPGAMAGGQGQWVSQSGKPPNHGNALPIPEIVEAQSWIIDPQGGVSLVVTAPGQPQFQTDSGPCRRSSL